MPYELDDIVKGLLEEKLVFTKELPQSQDGRRRYRLKTRGLGIERDYYQKEYRLICSKAAHTRLFCEIATDLVLETLRKLYFVHVIIFNIDNSSHEDMTDIGWGMCNKGML